MDERLYDSIRMENVSLYEENAIFFRKKESNIINIFCRRKYLMTTFEIILLVLFGVLAILVFICFLLLLKGKKKDSSIDEKQFYEYLEKVSEKNQKEVDQIKESQNEFQNKNQQQISSFKEEVNQSLQKNFHELKENQSSQKLDTSKEMNSFKEEMNHRLDDTFKTNLECQEKKNQQLNEKLDFFIQRSKEEIAKSYSDLLTLVTTQLNEMNGKVSETLKNGFESNSKSMGEVNIALGKITAAQTNLDSLKDQVVSLNNVLTNSQQRGRYGEMALESLLQEVFGQTRGIYDTQHVLKNKARPDAIVFLPGGEKCVCIDSKFPFVDYRGIFESEDEKEIHDLKLKFKAALKIQIKKIADDYVSKEDTADYAIMFIPSDGIYSFLQMEDTFYKEVVCLSRNLKVILTCPSTLQPILANIQMLKVNYDIARNIKNVLKQIQELRKENEKFSKDWETFSKSMDTMRNKKDEFTKRVTNFTKQTDEILTVADEKKLLEENADDKTTAS